MSTSKIAHLFAALGGLFSHDRRNTVPLAELLRLKGQRDAMEQRMMDSGKHGIRHTGGPYARRCRRFNRGSDTGIVPAKCYPNLNPPKPEEPVASCVQTV